MANALCSLCLTKVTTLNLTFLGACKVAKMLNIPELLSPAGNMESAIAAINAGADAIYVGGKNFSARSNAQNFTIQELVDLIEYSAVRGVRVYIAVNTIYKNTEIPYVVDFIAQMHKEGATAFILQDSGLAYILRSYFPTIEIHASTQMSVHSTEGVNFMEKMGFSRVVLSRELSLAEIIEINTNVKIETEVFIHGALCVSYSGQCLMSSLIGGRSGNRGKCAQICRTRFEMVQEGKSIQAGHLISPKDMMTIDILPNIVASGVTALKIEGRMKSPEYVYLVTKAYRQKLDNLQSETPDGTKQELLQIFNRGGSFTTGYYNMYNGKSMMSTVTPKSTGIIAGEVVSVSGGKCRIKFMTYMRPGDGIEIWTMDNNHVGMGINKEIAIGDTCEFLIPAPVPKKDTTSLDNSTEKNRQGAISKGCKVYKSYDKYLNDSTKKAINSSKRTLLQGQVTAVEGRNLSLIVNGLGFAAEAKGGLVELAKNAPIPPSDIVAQISKTGGTAFEIKFTNTNISDDIFVSKSELNLLRRTVLKNFEDEVVSGIKCIPSENEVRLHACFTESNFIKQNKSMAEQKPVAQKLSVQISNTEMLSIIEGFPVSHVYVNYNDIALLHSKHMQNDAIYIALPNISRNTLELQMVNELQRLEALGISGYLVSTYGQLHMLQKMQTKKHIMLNHTFNIFNSHSIEYFSKMGLGLTASQELNLHEIRRLNTNNFELIVYGRQILMATHNAPGCAGQQYGKNYTLRDRIGLQFPVQTDCKNCISYILNCKLLDTAPKFAEIKKSSANYFRLIFTTEKENEVKEIMQRYTASLDGQAPSAQIANATYGHFFRGVE